MTFSPHKLKAESLAISFNGVRFMEDISFRVDPGEIVGILGPSGAGKTTLFNMLAGLARPDEGKVFLDGKDITGENGHLGYMLQKDLLLPYHSVINNVSLPLQLRGLSKKEAHDIARPYFKEFGLEGTEDSYPKTLSGGMRQRAALLRTYLFGSDIILLDEPFSALDPMTRRSMQSWFLKMVEELGLSALLITHDIDEAILLSDRIYLLQGPPTSLTEILQIQESRPRFLDFTLTEAFLDYKRILSDALHQS